MTNSRGQKSARLRTGSCAVPINRRVIISFCLSKGVVRRFLMVRPFPKVIGGAYVVTLGFDVTGELSKEAKLKFSELKELLSLPKAVSQVLSDSTNRSHIARFLPHWNARYGSETEFKVIEELTEDEITKLLEFYRVYLKRSEETGRSLTNQVDIPVGEQGRNGVEKSTQSLVTKGLLKTDKYSVYLTGEQAQAQASPEIGGPSGLRVASVLHEWEDRIREYDLCDAHDEFLFRLFDRKNLICYPEISSPPSEDARS